MATSRAQLLMQDRPHLASNELCGNCAGRIGDQEYRVDVDGICFHRSCDLLVAGTADMEAAENYRRLAGIAINGHSRRMLLKRAEAAHSAGSAKWTEAAKIREAEGL